MNLTDFKNIINTYGDGGKFLLFNQVYHLPDYCALGVDSSAGTTHHVAVNKYIGDATSATPTFEVNGNISTNSHITASGNVKFSGLPTSDPGVAGALWVSGSTAGSDSSKILAVSQG